jgi:predicted heme/steroid binding protein
MLVRVQSRPLFMGKARDRRLKWLSRRGLPEGRFYCVSNYGWGDGSCDGPYSAYQALLKHCGNRGCTPQEILTKYGVSFKAQLKEAMGDRTMIHYISDYDESDKFDGDDW